MAILENVSSIISVIKEPLALIGLAISLIAIVIVYYLAVPDHGGKRRPILYAFMTICSVLIVALLLILATQKSISKPDSSVDNIATEKVGKSWLMKMVTDDWQWASDWINKECKPSGLDGIHIVSLQKGNNAPYNFYVFCRKDDSTDAEYRLSMTNTIDLSVVPPILESQARKLGPEYYSSTGVGGAFWVIEKTK